MCFIGVSRVVFLFTRTYAYDQYYQAKKFQNTDYIINLSWKALLTTKDSQLHGLITFVSGVTYTSNFTLELTER